MCSSMPDQLHANVSLLGTTADCIFRFQTTAEAPVRLATAGSGQGLRGMAERVALYDGRVEAEPMPGGGFQVSVFIPYTRGLENLVKRQPHPSGARG